MSGMFIHYDNILEHSDQESSINGFAQYCGISNTLGMKTLLVWHQAIVTENGHQKRSECVCCIAKHLKLSNDLTLSNDMLFIS